MFVFEVEIPAKMFIKMEGNTPEEAINNVESFLEDCYMQIPCDGHTIKLGKYPVKVWAAEGKPTIRRQLPEGTDPTQEEKFSMKAYMEMVFKPEEDE